MRRYKDIVQETASYLYQRYDYGVMADFNEFNFINIEEDLGYLISKQGFLTDEEKVYIKLSRNEFFEDVYNEVLFIIFSEI